MDAHATVSHRRSRRSTLINRHNIWLLKRATTYFKRELPCDRWRLFMKTAHANLPSVRFRQAKGTGQLLSKIRPISLGLPALFKLDSTGETTQKRTDLFFSGQFDNTSTVRQAGINELLSCERMGGFSIFQTNA